MKALAVEPARARAFVRRATRIDDPLPDVATALQHLGYAQIDPINVCGRMHDLVLRNRVTGYAEGDLLAHLYPCDGERRALEHFLPGQGILSAFPMSAWPFLVPHMRERARLDRGFNGRLTPAERKLARRILDEIAQRGALQPEDIENHARALTGWGTQGRAVKVLLEKLFVQGEVLISARRGFRRIYDLPERVLPRALIDAPVATIAESRRWSLLQRLRQRRLARLSRTELPLLRDSVHPVAVAGCPPLWCLVEDLELFESPPQEPCARMRLLAPLDPLVYDRVVTQRLWDFQYTWEVYTPPEKRQRGYYALPALAGNELVGHVDPRADRTTGRLRIMGRRLRRGHPGSAAVRELASFLGLKT